MYHHDIQYYCKGRPPLYYAIDFGLPFLIKALLPEKDQVDTLHNGIAALHETARCGDLYTALTLLDFGASVELKSSSRAKSMTALHFAAEWGHAPMIQLLLDRGASPHAQSRSLSTPFYRAARSGSLEALRLLHLAGSDINAKTWDNWTALFEAVAYGIIPIASQLLAWGADPTIVTDSDESALMIISAMRNSDRNIFKSHKDIMLNLDAECDQDIDTKKIRENREAVVLQEIQRLQTQSETSERKTGGVFFKYLCGLKPAHWRFELLENDTRSGIERDVSRRAHGDVE